jgi:hypothetical protein
VEVGAESVQTNFTGNEKENIAVVASAAAAGDKLPLQFITTRKTITVETTQIGSVDEHWRDHPQNLRQTSETFQS